MVIPILLTITGVVSITLAWIEWTKSRDQEIKAERETLEADSLRQELRETNRRLQESQKQLEGFTQASSKTLDEISQNSKTASVKPTLSVCTEYGLQFVKSSADSVTLKLSMCAHDATCSNVNIKIRSMTSHSKNGTANVTNGQVIFGPNFDVPVDDGFSTDLQIHGVGQTFDQVVVYISGTYWDAGKTTERHIETVLIYYLTTKKFAYLAEPRRTDALKLFNKKPL